MKNLLLALILISIFIGCKSEKKDLQAQADLAYLHASGYNMSNASTDVGKHDAEQKEDENIAESKSVGKQKEKVIREIIYVPQKATAQHAATEKSEF